MAWHAVLATAAAAAGARLQYVQYSTLVVVRLIIIIIIIIILDIAPRPCCVLLGDRSILEDYSRCGPDWRLSKPGLVLYDEFACLLASRP